jgi:myo-inositol catabolism protein IolC
MTQFELYEMVLLSLGFEVEWPSVSSKITSNDPSVEKHKCYVRENRMSTIKDRIHIMIESNHVNGFQLSGTIFYEMPSGINYKNHTENV